MEIAKIYNLLHSKIHTFKYDNWFHIKTDTFSENYKGYNKTCHLLDITTDNALDSIIEQLYHNMYKLSLIDTLYLKSNPITYMSVNKYNIDLLLSDSNKYNMIITSLKNKEIIDKLIYLRNPTTNPLKIKVLYSINSSIDNIYLLDKNKIDLKLEIGFKVSKDIKTKIETFYSLFINNLNVTELYLQNNTN